MTGYYQFGARMGLLAALFDSLASPRGWPAHHRDTAPRPASGAGGVHRQPRPLLGLRPYLIGRLQGLAAIDPDFQQIWHTREELRRQGLKALTERIAQTHGHPAPAGVDEAADILYGLVAFETFNSIAGTTRPYKQVSPIIYRLALTALGLGNH